MRGFESHIEDIAERWRGSVVTDEPWNRASLRNFETGESQAFPVRNAANTTSAFAKPGRRDATVPRAANEKIAADLAFELMLPVPPALLWHRENPPITEEEFACVSLTPFEPAHKWRDVRKGSQQMIAKIVAGLQMTAPAMMPFDCWLANADRVNEGNVVLQEDLRAASPVVRAAYIDYAYTMTYSWGERGELWRTINVPAVAYPTEVGVDVGAISATIDRIERLSQGDVEGIVSRIPEEFLTTQRKVTTIAGLVHRKQRLREEFRRVHPTLP
ncbi:MAG: hypothetical protein ABSC94_31555 [Polyangiaceae bacterium]